MKIYISVPISGRPIEEARHEADLTKRMLSIQGHQPVNPFEIYAGKNPTYEDHLACDLRALMDCDAIYMCPGWGLSIGCTIEFNVIRHLVRRPGGKRYVVIYGR